MTGPSVVSVSVPNDPASIKPYSTASRAATSTVTSSAHQTLFSSFLVGTLIPLKSLVQLGNWHRKKHHPEKLSRKNLDQTREFVELVHRANLPFQRLAGQAGVPYRANLLRLSQTAPDDSDGRASFQYRAARGCRSVSTAAPRGQ